MLFLDFQSKVALDCLFIETSSHFCWGSFPVTQQPFLLKHTLNLAFMNDGFKLEKKNLYMST